MLVGGGEDHETVVRQVSALGLEDRVRIVGRVSPEDVKHYVRLGVLTVDPVRADGAALGRSPLKIVESMALGVPVVTGDVGDRVHLLAGGEAGGLVAPGSVDALAQEIQRLLSNPSLLEEKQRACVQVARGYYWDHLVHRFVQVYEL